MIAAFVTRMAVIYRITVGSKILLIEIAWTLKFRNLTRILRFGHRCWNWDEVKFQFQYLTRNELMAPKMTVFHSTLTKLTDTDLFNFQGEMERAMEFDMFSWYLIASITIEWTALPDGISRDTAMFPAIFETQQLKIWVHNPRLYHKHRN